jgi:RNA-directed DNA polymerase
MYKRYEMLRELNRGWAQYFKPNDAKSLLIELDKWVRSRIRQCYWKQWKRLKTKMEMLIKPGTPQWRAYEWANTRKGYWRISHSPILSRVLNNSLLKREGYLSLAELNIQPTVLF